MGAGNAGKSNDSGGKDTKTPFGKASSTKTKTKFGYSKPPNKIKSFIKGGGVVGKIFSETIGKAAAKSNLKRRQKFISKYNTNVPPSEKINLTDNQILSKDGLSTLKGKGYTTISDRLVTNTGGKDNNDADKNNQTLPVLTQPGIFPGESNPTAPSVPLDPEPSEKDKKYDARKTKKKGMTKNILTSKQGVTKTAADYTLGVKNLLGRVV